MVAQSIKISKISRHSSKNVPTPSHRQEQPRSSLPTLQDDELQTHQQQRIKTINWTGRQFPESKQEIRWQLRRRDVLRRRKDQGKHAITKELVLRQTFLIAKGYFDPKEYFQAIKIDNLDDPTFDNKIKAMFNWSHHPYWIILYFKTWQPHKSLSKSIRNH